MRCLVLSLGEAALLRFAVILALASTMVSPADAFTPTADQKACATLPANADVVAACTRIIEAPSSSTLDRAVSYTFRADAARADGNTTTAIADYSQALSLMPTLVPALSGRGTAYRATGDFDRAIQDYDQAIKLNPNDATAFYYRGIANGQRGESDRAIQDFSQAIKINPNHVDALYSRGLTYSNKGLWDRAIQDYDKALKLDPNYGKAIRQSRQRLLRQAPI